MQPFVSTIDSAVRNRYARIARLDERKAVIPRTVTEGVRHNKFIVLLQNEKPVGIDRLNQHLRGRYFRAVERRAYRLELDRRTGVPGLLGATG